MSYILEALKKSEQERRRGEVPEITHFDTNETKSSAGFKLWPVVVIILLVVNIGGIVIWAPWEDKATQVATQNAAPIARETDSSRLSSAPQAISMSTPDKGPKAVTAKPTPSVSGSVSAKKPVAVQPEPSAKSVLNPVTAPKRIAPEVVKKPASDKRTAPVVAAEPELITPRTRPEPNASTQSATQNRTHASSGSTRSRPVETSYLPQLQELPASLQDRIPDMSFSSHMYSSQARYRSIIINGRRLKEGQFLNDEIQVREITEKGVVLGLEDTLFEVDVLGQWVN